MCFIAACLLTLKPLVSDQNIMFQRVHSLLKLYSFKSRTTGSEDSDAKVVLTPQSSGNGETSYELQNNGWSRLGDGDTYAATARAARSKPSALDNYNYKEGNKIDRIAVQKDVTVTPCDRV